ncbi:MAG: lyase family protein [Patescibacteria group bacterium]
MAPDRQSGSESASLAESVLRAGADDGPELGEDRYEALSPVDYRYAEETLRPFLSENAFTRYKAAVEVALVETSAEHGLCPPEVAEEIAEAAKEVRTSEVYRREREITKHDIRALADEIRDRVSDEAKPFVHRMATSYDIVDTANAARFRDAAVEVVLPELVRTHGVVLDLTERYADQRQIGRTHGQHAVPITFGFAMAEYADRLGNAIRELQGRAGELRGKFSGAVGAYNASSLFVEDPQAFERDVLAKLGLESAGHATQIVPPEHQTRFLYSVMEAGAVLANLADDMRHLQRSEIGEVGEPFAEGQAGSSTMTQKRNPINFENTSSMGRELVARFVGAMLDLRSEHQRDLTGSASGRTRGEMLVYLTGMAKRMRRTMGKLQVDEANMERNLEMSRGAIMGEPVYLLLAAAGHPDAYEKSKQLTLQAEDSEEDFFAIVERDPEVQEYFADLTDDQKGILRDPTKYTGLAADKARERVAYWRSAYRVS